jgi:CBS domain-containing protein
MIHDPMTIAPSTPVAEAARLMREAEVELLPEVEHVTLVGVVTDAMLLRLLAALLGRPERTEVAALMSGVRSRNLDGV